MKTQLSRVAATVSALLITFAFGCGSSKSGDPLVGEWQMEGQAFTVTIQADGTIRSPEDGSRKEKLAKCKAGGSNIKMRTSIWKKVGNDYEIGGPGLNTQKLPGGKMKCSWTKGKFRKVTLSGDTFTLVNGDKKRTFKRK